MRETTPSAMPPCFERWCARFDDCFKNQSQKNRFRTVREDLESIFLKLGHQQAS